MSMVLEMYNYHAWANQKLFERLKELPNDVFHHEIESVFPTISGVFSHMYTVDQLWFYIISGMDMSEALGVEKKSGEGKSIYEMEILFDNLSERYKELLRLQTHKDDSRLLNIPWEGKQEISLFQMVMHVVTHGSYHRGNVTAMLRQLGYPSTTTDLTVYWFADITR